LARQLAERHGIEVECNTRTGLAAREVALFGQAEEAQLLVIGEHGEDWLGDTVLGGTALKLLKRAELPVLLVRRPARPEFSNILVASDFSDHALRAAELACQWFPHAQKLLVHAYLVAFESRIRLAGASPDDIERYRSNEASRAQQLLDEQVSKLDAGPEVGRLLSRGAPAAVLIAQAKRLAADLIVIGKHGGSSLDERLLGSVTQNVLYQADCNVLLIP
jgi:nucleotide-binding universal stress UspA family protein